jgi:hypothetical protein
VRGTTKVQAHASRVSGHVVVSGSVTDDAGRADPAERVMLSFSRSSGDAQGVGQTSVNVSAAVPEACSLQVGGSASAGPPPALTLIGPDRLAIPVDAQGRFCARLVLDADRYVAHLEAPASERVDGATLEWPIDLRVPPLAIVTLAFDPARTILSLDDATTDVVVVASIDEEGVLRGGAGLPVAVSNESGTPLGEAVTTPSGRALVRVDSFRLGALGPGELRASFAGSATASASRCAIPVERRARVDLSLDDSVRTGAASKVAPGSPEDGVALKVTAVARCAAAGCTGVPSGAVEARVDDAVVGAATLAQGKATLVVTFAALARPEVAVRLRYLPDAPWLEASDDLVAALPVQGPSPWRRLLLAFASLVTIVWLVLGRLDLRQRAKGTGAKAGKGAGGQVVARVELLAPSPGGGGWTGKVVDAHEDTALGGARIAVERRGFERVEVKAEARTGDDGRFTLAPVDSIPGDEIVAEGPLHAPIREALPATGDLRVALVLRRRAVLDRMVAWARKRGKPFDARPDPTPGHVRRAAGGDSPVGRWADAVERAAFGGEVVDAQAHAELEKLSPAAADSPDPPIRPERPRAR